MSAWTREAPRSRWIHRLASFMEGIEQDPSSARQAALDAVTDHESTRGDIAEKRMQFVPAHVALRGEENCRRRRWNRIWSAKGRERKRMVEWL